VNLSREVSEQLENLHEIHWSVEKA